MFKKFYQNNSITLDTKSIAIQNTKNNYNVVSLFSGGGGMDLGFTGGFTFLDEYYEKNPFKIVFANDIFKQAAEVYEANFKHLVERRSITDLDVNKDLPEVRVDVVLGGFPCQTFSYAGKRAGLSDERGQLYKQMIKVVNHYRPKVFVAENVDGIRNSKKNHSGEIVDKSALRMILDEFEKIGYNVDYKVLNAADFGVPQSRKRVIIIGVRNDLGSCSNIYYPKSIYDETGDLTGKVWRTAKDGIDDLWDKVNSSTIPNHSIKDISRAKFYPGKKCKEIIVLTQIGQHLQLEQSIMGTLRRITEQLY